MTKRTADTASGDVATFHHSIRPEGPHRIRTVTVEMRWIGPTESPDDPSPVEHILFRRITYFQRKRILACDGLCAKAWGSTRPREQLDPDDIDDFALLSDDELGEAPADPGTYEGSHGKPSHDEKLKSKWCARQCERSVIVDLGSSIELRDFSRRRYNIAPHTRDTPDGGCPDPKENVETTAGLTRTALEVVNLANKTDAQVRKILEETVAALWQAIDDPENLAKGLHPADVIEKHLQRGNIVKDGDW